MTPVKNPPRPRRIRWIPARVARVALIATAVLVTLGAGVLWGTYRTLGPDLRDLLSQVEGVSPEAMQLLEDYNWPGNVRELENIIERALVLGSGRVILPDEIAQGISFPAGVGVAMEVSASAPTDCTLAEMEKQHVERVLEQMDGHRQKTASALGISERSLRDRLKRWKEAEE